MPRGKIDLDTKVESLSILNPSGNVDTALEPEIEDADLRRLFRCLLLSRRFDERMLKLQRQGRVGTYGPSLGQEAASLGPAFAIGRDDWFIPSFRETAGMLWRGWPIEKIMWWWAGHEVGARAPEGVNDLPICVPVGSQCLHAAGLAWSCRLKGTRSVAVGFLGDGATSEGDFHEAMNCAAVLKAPLVTVIQNNQWAISLPRARQTAATTLAQKAVAYGMDGIQVDGNDLLAVIAATREAVAKARDGGGPTLIEAVTYRLGVHTTADDPKKYRTDEEVELWRPKDPLPRFQKYLQNKSLLDAKALALLEAEVTDEIAAAVEQAEAFEPDLTEPFHHCFARMPEDLRMQLDEFQAYLAQIGEGAAGDNNGNGAEQLSENVPAY
ncbi:MAG: pyruvate dehydrogenase (acetyl-transferring) E1 component subunit alpha [Phycisphaerae bacterium]